MRAEALGGIVATVQSPGGFEMSSVGKKKTRRRPKAKKRVQASDGANLTQAGQPSLTELQIDELERTFTGRWEW